MAGDKYAPSPLAKEALIALGRQLAKLRNEAGYSQLGFASLTGFSRTTLSDVELGRHWLSRDFWVSADRALKMDGKLLAAFDRIAHLRADKRLRFPASSHEVAAPHGQLRLPAGHPARQHDHHRMDPRRRDLLRAEAVL